MFDVKRKHSKFDFNIFRKLNPNINDLTSYIDHFDQNNYFKGIQTSTAYLLH